MLVSTHFFSFYGYGSILILYSELHIPELHSFEKKKNQTAKQQKNRGIGK